MRDTKEPVMIRSRAAATRTPRVCYVCGQLTVRRHIVEPLLLPTCLNQECRERAEQLPRLHCSTRLADARICGAPAAQMQVDAQWVCRWHSRAPFDGLFAA
jgi:hypothetical protein